MNNISNALFDSEIALEKASYTAENLSEELSFFLKLVKEEIGDKGETFLVGISIILDYLGEVRGGLKGIREALTEMENQGKKEG